ncbi:MAG: hypothetical protein KME59_10785 [Trichormus sp. ATA11-4-KO1]|jgi:hypothetical protein|nr:hypothetical protein [Trichormus sp. ATA11-4-KO1]
MAEPTLQQVFGANATQDINSITISKTDLAAVGLTANATNTAESLLIAINLLAKTYLTQANFDANIDQSIIVENGFSSFTTRGVNNDSYRTDQLTVTLAKLDSSTLDPDDY